jgi:hypothetical protein
MIDIEIIVKALKLAWISRLLSLGKQNWKTVPDYYLRKLGGLSFLLRCNYDPKHLISLSSFYRSILVYFNELKSLYGVDEVQDIILFNNKEILVEGKPVFIREWFNKGIISIQDLLNDFGCIMSYVEFKNKYSCQSNFLQYYQVISAIPKYLLTKAKNNNPIRKELYSADNVTIQLDDSTHLDLTKAKTRDFYNLLNAKTHTVEQTGPQRWNKSLSMNEGSWKKAFTSLKKLCKDKKLREFQFKFIHRIVVTKKELHRYGIKPDDDCIYCGEKDSIDHTFRDCQFTTSFETKVINWFNETNHSQLNPSIEEKLFGLTTTLYNTALTRKFNYSMLFMRNYIYICKLHEKPILLRDFVNRIQIKYKIEKIGL